MNTPYGLEIIDSCLSCRMKREECFCNLSSAALKTFSAISHQTAFPQARRCLSKGRVRGEYFCSAREK